MDIAAIIAENKIKEAINSGSEIKVKECLNCDGGIIIDKLRNHMNKEDEILFRITLDLIDLNIHRTPLNCLQLLIAFLNNFENRPINRSNVFSYLLKVIFDNPGNLFYGNTLDDKNCVYILGNFCEYLLFICHTCIYLFKTKMQFFKLIL